LEKLHDPLLSANGNFLSAAVIPRGIPVIPPISLLVIKIQVQKVVDNSQ
jgi:hypothetical protein